MSFRATILAFVGLIALNVVIGCYFGWTAANIGAVVLNSLIAAAWLLLHGWESRLIRQLAALPPDEREFKLAAMNGVQRERVRALLKSYATEPRVETNQPDAHKL